MHARVDRRGEFDGARVRPMTVADLDQVIAIELASFSTPWPREHFLFEMRENRYASNVVLENDARVLGYASVWFMYEELKINNIAIHPDARGHGLGGRLLRRLMERGVSKGCSEATLEVRPSNLPALTLYKSHGFKEVTRRRDYYPDTHEEAILMRAPLQGG